MNLKCLLEKYLHPVQIGPQEILFSYLSVNSLKTIGCAGSLVHNMARVELFLILVFAIAASAQYKYEKPLLSPYITKTENWAVLSNGERAYTVKYPPNTCFLKLHLKGNTRYMDCRNEYLIAGGATLCGKLNNYYEYKPKEGDRKLRYRGDTPLIIEIEPVECGYRTCDVVTSDVYSEITSPNYPNDYSPSSSCHYKIHPANEAICQVSIYFHEFDVEDSPGCNKDKLLIDDEPFCGRTKNYRVNRNLTTGLDLRFESDSSINGKGFRLSVEQIHCGNTLRYKGDQSNCCRRDYKDSFMIITSPGFLTHHLGEYDCLFTIYPAHQNVCRIRFYFKHFWVGEEDMYYGCINGFLEIDGKRFCGCLDGYMYVSYFDETGRKELRFSHRGPGNRGFVIEAIQEQCGPDYPFTNNTEIDPNTEIEVFGTNITSEKAVSRFILPREASRCYQWTQPGWEVRVKNYLTSAPVPAFCEAQYSSQFFPDIPMEEPAFVPHEPPFLPPSPLPPFLPPSPLPPFLPPPSLPPFLPPPSLPPFLPPPSLPPFRPNPHAFIPPSCLVFSYYTGQFKSPLYPSRYPPNVRICYAFQAAPGFCKLLIKFREFDLEKSLKCWKDYVQIDGGKRYCGNYFRGQTGRFEFRRDRPVFLHFVTDGYFAGRGFFGTYKQLPCSVRLAHLKTDNNTTISSVEV